MDGYVTIGTKLDTKGFDKEIAILEDKLNDIQSTLQLADEDKTLFSTSEIKQMEAEAQKLGRRIDTLREKQRKIDSAGFLNMKGSIEDVGKGVQKVTSKIAKMALAVFGIRSAFMFVRNAINTISSDDAQLKADIDYMKNAIAYTLEPVVRGIVNLAKQLLFYIGYIIKAWTGKNIFENANKSLKNANGQAKKLQKTLAGFDEMNVLSDTSSSGGGATAPSFDLTNPENIEPPAWIVWIAENKDTVIAGLLGIAAALLVVKLGITGLVGGLITGLLVYMVAMVIKNWNKIKEILSGVASWFYETIIKPVADFFTNLWDGIKNGVGIAIEWVKNKFSSIIDFFANLISKIVGLFKKIGTKVGEVIGSAFKSVINAVLRTIENILNFPIRSINKLINVINKVPGINLGTLTEFSLPRLAKGGIINMPGKGVPVGSAIGGERGQEGVIPLTDSQQMELLGEAIGKYININATIPVYVGNRQITREIRKINAEDDFAYNR